MSSDGYTKAKQHTFKINFDSNEKLEIKIEPLAVAFSGQLRFDSEEGIDEILPLIKMNVSGEQYPITEIKDVEFEENFREYKVWVPYERFKKLEMDFVVEPVIAGQTRPIVLKPERKEFMLSRIEPMLTNHITFKVVEGMFVEG